VADKLAQPGYDLPISFVYGDNDWVQMLEEDVADLVIQNNKYRDEPAPRDDQNEFEPYHKDKSKCLKPTGLYKSRVHIVPTSDHNMSIDNPHALASVIINDIYDTQLPVEANETYLEAAPTRLDGQ